MLVVLLTHCSTWGWRRVAHRQCQLPRPCQPFMKLGWSISMCLQAAQVYSQPWHVTSCC